MDGLSEGRIIHFVEQEGFCLPGILNEILDRDKGLVSFGLCGVEYKFKSKIPYSETKEVGTWHWPERS